jgi:hypothetical protein
VMILFLPPFQNMNILVSNQAISDKEWVQYSKTFSLFLMNVLFAILIGKYRKMYREYKLFYLVFYLTCTLLSDVVLCYFLICVLEFFVLWPCSVLQLKF